MKIDSDLHIKVVQEYTSGLSMQNVAELNKISSSGVFNILKKYNIQTRPNSINSRKYFINDEYFSNIDNQHKAYWIGFIQTDGYLLTNTKSIGIALAEKDYGHLEKFKKDVDATYPIRMYKSSGYSNSDYARIIVKSEKMWNDLNNIGITPKKTKTTKPISFSKDLERHYVRGLMDGDGSIKISKFSKYGYRGDFTSATKVMAQYVADTLGKGAIRLDKNKNVWYSEFSLTMENMEYLYADATVYLQRKYDRILRARSRV